MPTVGGGPPPRSRLVDDPPFALGLTPRSDDGRGMGDAAIALDRGRGRRADLDPLGGRRPRSGRLGRARWSVAAGHHRRSRRGVVVGRGVRGVGSRSSPPTPTTRARCPSPPWTAPASASVSHQNRDWLAEVDFGPTEVVRATGPGEQPIEGWLTRPSASARHGGATPLDRRRARRAALLRGSPVQLRDPSAGGARIRRAERATRAAAWATARHSVGRSSATGVAVDLADVLALTDARASSSRASTPTDWPSRASRTAAT